MPNDLDKLKKLAKDMGYTFEHTKYGHQDYFIIFKPKGSDWFELRLDNTETNRNRCMAFLEDVEAREKARRCVDELENWKPITTTMGGAGIKILARKDAARIIRREFGFEEVSK